MGMVVLVCKVSGMDLLALDRAALMYMGSRVDMVSGMGHIFYPGKVAFPDMVDLVDTVLCMVQAPLSVMVVSAHPDNLAVFEVAVSWVVPVAIAAVETI
jgi:hypothetical protein